MDHQQQQQPQPGPYQPQIDGPAINGLGPPPDLVVRPAAADANAYGHAVVSGHAAAPVVAARQVYYPPVAAAAAAAAGGLNQHGGGAVVVGQAAQLQPVHAAAAVGCQVCGAGLLPVAGGPAVGAGRRVVPLLPTNSRQNPRIAAHPPGGPSAAAAAAGAAPAVVYGGAAEGVQLAEAEPNPAQRQRQADSTTMTDPLPDLVNAHRIPSSAAHSQQPSHHHHRHLYQQHNGNHQQQQQQQQQQQAPCQQQDGAGAEMMMLYDDPGRCWLSQCAAYRNGNAFVQYVSTAGSAGTYSHPIYQRADSGKSCGELSAITSIRVVMPRCE